jgi:hypothetical protein
MRRIVSITTLSALLAAMFSPLMMVAKMQTEMCPLLKQKGHKCEAMLLAHMNHQAPGAAGFSMSDPDGKCPAECLMASSSQHAAAASVLVLSPPRAAHVERLIPSLFFIAAGYSSHTDRGPPVIELSA